VPLVRLAVLLVLLCLPAAGGGAPGASFVVDLRDGTVYHAENADARLHPASLTKMMTLYLAFEAFERGRDPDAVVTVSAKAAAEAGSRLGLRAGQRISLRHLVRAVAVASANDAATALAEALGGSEAAFVAEMNARAADLGMAGTTFRNAHGLTAEGHLSTARDMSLLGRHLFFDYPEYWGLFGRLQADAGVATVAHTNRRFLSGYGGADGIKTGYTRAAGFNLTASAARGEKRLVVTVFGAPSSAARAARVARLMDAAFARAPEMVALRAPDRGRALRRAGAPAGDWLGGAAPLVGAGPRGGEGRVPAAWRRVAPGSGPGLALGIAPAAGRSPRAPGGLELTLFGGG